MKEKDEEEVDEGGYNSRTKITIVGDNYQLKQVSDGDVLWNLYFKRKKKNGEFKWDIESYGVTISRAIPKIINYNISQKLNGRNVTLRQYLQIWLKVSEVIYKELRGL